MVINQQTLRTLFTGFSAAFRKGMDAAPSQYGKIAMTVPSQTRENEYGWLGAMPRLREWVGDRVIQNLSVHSYAVKNRTFEATVSIPREDIEDDRYGVFAPVIEQMGVDARLHPDELVFGLLAAGFDTIIYDGQYFFDADHPVGDGAEVPVHSVSNVQAGAGPAWFLLDCSKPIKPLLFQERRPYKFTSLDREDDENVFFRKEYIYGVDARANAGFGLWQLAFGSKAALTKENYEAARRAMMGQKSDTGRPLNVKPTHLVVPPALEGDALRLLNAAQIGGTTNEWAGTAELIVTQFLG